ncbi:MAG: hypothetical protein ACOX8W_01755 [bacterium]|jgi:hypothetical protein
MSVSLRKKITAACLCSCLLLTAGCVATLPPRLERDAAKINLTKEWNKIVRYTGIDDDQVMLSDLIVRCDDSGTVESFRLQFFNRTDDDGYTLHDVNYNGGDEIKCYRQEMAGTTEDAVLVSNVFAAIDAYGFANFGRDISGPIGMMLSTVWGKTYYQSGDNCKVYLLAAGETTPVDNQTFELGREYVALNVWEAGENPSQAGRIVFIIQVGSAAAETDAAGEV